MNHTQSRLLSLLALSMVALPALVAQESTGSLVGTVRDKAGKPLSGVTIRLSSPALQGARTFRSAADGTFRAPLLPPGSYTVGVTKEGFVGPLARVEVLLSVVSRQDLLMAPLAEAGGTIEVVATASSVDKTETKASTTITSEMMDVLPRTTRGLDTAAFLAPGVAVGVGGRVQIRGGQSTQNRFLLNGTDIADNVFGNTNGRNFYVDDAIDQTQIIQSPVNPRYGNFTGGIINAITKTGGNEWSGSIRGNFNRSAWSASAPVGLQAAQGNSRTLIGRLNSEDELNRSYAVWLGGPIVKDKLWFAFSTKLDPSLAAPQVFSNVTGFTLGDGSGGAAFGTGAGQSGGAFTLFQENTFYEAKFTWAITPNHTLEVAGNTNKTPQKNRFYVLSFDQDTLVPQDNENDYKTVQYRGVIAERLTVEARWAKKHQLLSAGGDPTKGDPIRARYSNGGYYIFHNGIFDKTDGGDIRDINTMTLHATWFLPKGGWGSHILEGGFEFLDQDRQSANSQSPTGRNIWVWGRNADGSYRAAGLGTSSTAFGQNFIALYQVDKGTATTETRSIYLSDTWTLNDHWQFLLGGRHDKVASMDTLGSETISSSRFSPRFQATYDLKGDQAWLFRLSYARFVGKLNDSFTNLFTRAGSPVTEFYGWKGAARTNLTLSEVRDLNNWDISAAGFQGQTGPFSRVVDKNTKAPYTDEKSLSMRHNFKDGSTISFTYTEREGGGFFNEFLTVGDQFSASLRFIPGTQAILANRWATDNSLTRDYKSLEIEFQNRLSAHWTFGGNYTYAILRGNSEGSEGGNPPVQGDVIGDYTAVHNNSLNVATFNGQPRTARGVEFVAPDGYLTGDKRHSMRMYLNYVNKLKSGPMFNASLLFNYDGGGRYSLTRNLAFEARSDATLLAASNPAINPNLYPNTYTRFYGPRGLGSFNDTFNFDLKLGLEVPMFWRVRGFMEVTVLNVFNHWQIATHLTTSGSGSTLATNDPRAGFAATVPTLSSTNATGFGVWGPGQYVGGRTIVLSTGFRF